MERVVLITGAASGIGAAAARAFAREGCAVVMGDLAADRLHEVGRIAQAEDIAGAMTYLASPGALHINGVALRVDGGDCLAGAL